jgi:hypothetical protein
MIYKITRIDTLGPVKKQLTTNIQLLRKHWRDAIIDALGPYKKPLLTDMQVIIAEPLEGCKLAKTPELTLS